MQPLVANFDGHIGKDARHVSDTATTLGVREVDVFRLAYQAWHGAEPHDSELDQAFGGYLRDLEVPYWVRHFCRQTVGEDRAEVTKPPRFNLPDPLADSGQYLCSLVTVAALLAYVCMFA